MGSRDSGRSDRVNREAKRNRDGSKNTRDNLTDEGRLRRDRTPGGWNGYDHLWAQRNGMGCSSCHSGDPHNSYRSGNNHDRD